MEVVKRFHKSALWAARDWAGKTQPATVEHLKSHGIECSISTMWRWEGPEFDPLSLPLKTLEVLAAWYGCSVDSLTGRRALPERNLAEGGAA